MWQRGRETHAEALRHLVTELLLAHAALGRRLLDLHAVLVRAGREEDGAVGVPQRREACKRIRQHHAVQVTDVGSWRQLNAQYPSCSLLPTCVHVEDRCRDHERLVVPGRRGEEGLGLAPCRLGSRIPSPQCRGHSARLQPRGRQARDEESHGRLGADISRCVHS